MFHNFTRTLLLPALFALPLASCAHPSFDSSPSGTSTASPAFATGVPLPPGARKELASDRRTPQPDEPQPRGSLKPNFLPPAENMPEIVQRGFLIVGVDQSQNLLSFRDATTGELRGFEVDIAREIARDIFGDPNSVDFRFVDASDQQTSLQNKRVDLVIRALPITRQGEEDYQFSTAYLTANTRLLTLGERDPDDANTICVADRIGVETIGVNYAPNADVLKTRSWSDCLVALQQHQADVVLSDDTILAGIAAQDPYTRIVGPVLHRQRYGIAFAASAPAGHVRQINATLDRIKRDGTWWRLYNQWLADVVPTDGPPPSNYRQEQP